MCMYFFNFELKKKTCFKKKFCFLNNIYVFFTDFIFFEGAKRRTTSKHTKCALCELDIHNNRDDTLLWWLLLLLIFGVFRKSAGTVESQLPKHMNKQKIIMNRDVYPDSITKNKTVRKFVMIEIYVSKNDYIGKGQKIFLTHINSNVNTMEAWEVFMSFRTKKRWNTFYTEPDDPYFVWSSGHVIFRRSLYKHLHGLLQGANIDYSAFRDIASRRCRTQGAANVAQTDKTIKTLGNWSSDAFKLYWELSRSAFLQICRRMGDRRATK